MKPQLITLNWKYYFLLFCFFQFNGYSQNSDWITLSTPQSGLLGAPIDKIVNFDLNFDFAINYDKNPSIETRESSESIIEYEKIFRNFTTKYFKSEKTSIQKITAHNLEVRTLSYDAINNLQIGGKYIYQGLVADSVSITISAKKEFSSEISKVLKDVSSAITNPNSTKIIEKIAPILDSIRYTKNDSVFYDLKIKNPNVYYKVKVIKLKKKINTCGCNWETNCFKVFDYDFGKPGPPSKTRLIYSYTEEKSRTMSIYPDFCGRDIKGWQFFLKLDKKDDGLHLWIYSTSKSGNSSERSVMEVPYKDFNGERQWRLNRTLVDTYAKRGRVKNVLIEVSARQIDENSIDIINYVTNNEQDRYLTTMKYPEFKGKYVRR